MALQRIERDAIADSAINADKIADGTVVSTEIADGAVISSKIATDAIISVKIADGSVTEAKIDASTMIVDPILGTLRGHIIPDTNNAYDFGSASYKLRDVYVSENSLWLGDNHKMDTKDGKMKFRKRKKGKTPAVVETVLIGAGKQFANEAAMLVDFKTKMWSAGTPVNSLDPEHVDFNPALDSWPEYLRLLGHSTYTRPDQVFDNTADFDVENDRKPYDISFLAGFDGSTVKSDIEVRTYAEMVMARTGIFEGEVGYIDTVCTGQALICDVLKNGTSIYSTKPQFAISGTTITAGVISTPAFVSGDKVTFKVTQIGSTIVGQGIRFMLKCSV